MVYVLVNMAKKQKISDKIQAKFDKPQFRIGDAVFFSWLGQKQYGHVIRIKKATWGIQYSVEAASGTKYPCGIQIQGQKTHYNTGFIILEDTRTIGTEELERRIQTTKNEPKEPTKVFVNHTRTTHESGDDNSSVRTDDANIKRKNSTNSKKRSSKSNDNASSSAGTSKRNPTKRKAVGNPQLEDAIQRQRDFLNGFIK
jgi:hypothetical protein